jgi:hypothetical protein
MYKGSWGLAAPRGEKPTAVTLPDPVSLQESKVILRSEARYAIFLYILCILAAIMSVGLLFLFASLSG